MYGRSSKFEVYIKTLIRIRNIRLQSIKAVWKKVKNDENTSLIII